MNMPLTAPDLPKPDLLFPSGNRAYSQHLVLDYEIEVLKVMIAIHQQQADDIREIQQAFNEAWSKAFAPRNASDPAAVEPHVLPEAGPDKFNPAPLPIDKCAQVRQAAVELRDSVQTIVNLYRPNKPSFCFEKLCDAIAHFNQQVEQ